MFCIQLPFQSCFCCNFFKFFFVHFLAWMFSLIPKSDAGLWLGPVEFSPPVALYPRAVRSGRTLFYVQFQLAVWQSGELLLCTWESSDGWSTWIADISSLQPYTHHITLRVKGQIQAPTRQLLPLSPIIQRSTGQWRESAIVPQFTDCCPSADLVHDEEVPSFQRYQ